MITHKDRQGRDHHIYMQKKHVAVTSLCKTKLEQTFRRYTTWIVKYIDEYSSLQFTLIDR